MTCSRSRTAFFDTCAPEWDQKMGRERADRVHQWCRALPMDDDAIVLDVGCGTGVSSVALAEKATRGRVIALDLSRAMLREGRKRRGHPRVHWLCADAGRLPLADASVHLVLAMHLWPHLDAPEATLIEWRRVLRPAGTLWIVHLIPRERVNAIHREHAGPVHGDVLPPAGELARLVQRCGFRIDALADDRTHYLIRATRAG